MNKKFELSELKVKSFVTNIANEELLVGGLKGSSVRPTDDNVCQEKSQYPNVCPIRRREF